MTAHLPPDAAPTDAGSPPRRPADEHGSTHAQQRAIVSGGSSAEEAPSPVTGWAAVRNVVLCLGVALLCSAGLSSLGTWPRAEVLRGKLQYFAEHKDEYDTLFIGSSLTFRSISPEDFDAVMAERGHPTRSYNFGVMGMTAHEVDHVLKQLLAMEPARLERLFVELTEWSPVVSEGDELTDRFIAWHSVEQLPLLAGSLQASPGRWNDKLVIYGKHVLHAFLKLASVGQGMGIIKRAIGVPDWETPIDESFVADRAGFDALRPDTDRPDLVSRRERFLSRQKQFNKEIRDTVKGNRAKGSLDRLNVDAMRQQVAAIRAYGLEPIYFIPPFPKATPHLNRLAREGIVPTFFGFNDPKNYWEFFDAAGYFDSRHLDEDQARRFSRRFAVEYARSLEETDGES